MGEQTDRQKQAAAESAVEQLRDGMVVGLGSRSTAEFAVAAIAERVRGGLRIIGIPTSEKTAGMARGLGIPLTTLAERPAIDVTIDGADEVELGSLNLIKGGGGNLLREKIVAAASRSLFIIVDETKLVQSLGTRAPLPVEVVPFGWQSTAKRLEGIGVTPVLREAADGKPFVTDGGNYILDCRISENAVDSVGPVAGLGPRLDSIVGVVEHGLFIGMASRVFVGTSGGVQLLERG